MLKTRIVDELGERALLLPDFVNRGLAANDRVKYLFSLLQGARQKALDPQADPPDLHAERLASGVEDAGLDRVAAESRLSESGDLLIPQSARIYRMIGDCIGEMLVAAEVGADPDHESLTRRFRDLFHADAVGADDIVRSDLIGAMTNARRGSGDSLHLLVMDLHKVLNRLQAGMAVESIDGAMVYGIEDADRSRIAAFMRGLNATAVLKFDHPGLGTTATRSGSALVLQNDIGTTDAHVLIIRAEQSEVSVTYTDVHLRRTRFFQSLFEHWQVDWNHTQSRHSERLEEGADFYGMTGRYAAAGEADLEAFLAFLGSRIVFLIDWNRARKRLRGLVKNRSAVALLKWAADHDYGHRAFLELGAENLVHEAIQRAIPGPYRYGSTLHDVLEPDEAIAFLRFVLKCTAEGLREGRSARMVQDEVRAELLEHVTTSEENYLLLLADHAALMAELANAVRDGIARARTGAAGQYLERVARRAKRWESQADQIVAKVRDMARRATGNEEYAELCGSMDEVADQLEDAAYLLGMLPTVESLDAVEWPLNQLAEKVLTGVHTLVSCLESMTHLKRGAPREDMHDFLAAIDRMEKIEHDTDELERKITTALIERAADAGQLHLFSQLARRLERSADWIARCGWKMRDHVLT